MSDMFCIKNKDQQVFKVKTSCDWKYKAEKDFFGKLKKKNKQANSVLIIPINLVLKYL